MHPALKSRTWLIIGPTLLVLVLITGYLVWAQEDKSKAPSQNAQTSAAPENPAAQAKLPNAQDIVAFLNQTISWYRHNSVEQQLATEPSDILYVNDNRQIADQVLRLSFDFARADAQLMAKTAADTSQPQSPGQPNAASRYQALVNMAANSDKQVKQAQADLESLRQRLGTVSGSRRKALESAIAETQSELDLAQTRRDVTQSMLEFIRGTNANDLGPGGLRSQIDELERTVPAAAGKTSNGNQSPANNAATSNAAVSEAASKARKGEPSGLIELISDLVALTRKMHTLDETIQMTDSLAQAAKDIRSPLGSSLRDMIQKGDQLSQEPNSTDPVLLAEQKARLDAITSQFKLRSDAVLPLVKQRILLDLYKRNLTNWRGAVKAQHTTELKSVIVRLVIFGILLAVVFAGAELWRRTIFHYVSDVRRRYQLLLVRRIVLWFVIAIIIAFAFATELGSLATFAGLLTAGVAVALQNVILSVAGYFFLIGKYGVRVGDRVQIANVTGEVVDIGLVRLHLMELGSGGSDAQPTGRVVVFSNSVVFQPTSGLFKQIPGTSFVWHEITLTLAPDSNYRAVEDRLLGAVEEVFAEYREKMERQRRQMEKTIASLAIGSLGPQSRLRLTQTGLDVVIRYPVDLENAARIDDRITRALLDAIEHEPKLRLVGSGTPNIQPVPIDTAEEVKG